MLYVHLYPVTVLKHLMFCWAGVFDIFIRY